MLVIDSCFECPYCFVKEAYPYSEIESRITIDGQWLCKHDKNNKPIDIPFVDEGFPYWCKLSDYATEKFLSDYDVDFEYFLSDEAKFVLTLIFNSPTDFWNSFIKTKRLFYKGRKKDRKKSKRVICFFCNKEVEDEETYYMGRMNNEVIESICFCESCKKKRRLDKRFFLEKSMTKSNLGSSLKNKTDFSHNKIKTVFKEIEKFMTLI